MSAAIISDASNWVLRVVREQLVALNIPGVSAETLEWDTLLVDELGVDSLKFVDLTVGLEEALGLDVLPMQEWVDAQMQANRPLSIGELVAACQSALSRADGSAKGGTQ